MEIEQIKRIEHFAISIEISLIEFCDRFQSLFELPKMAYDFENETEWAEIEFNGINYNVSKPYSKGTLTEWDSSVPENCNFGICFGILNKNSDFNDTEINQIGNLLSARFETNVYYHRTWFGKGNNIKQNIIFKPKRNEAN